MKHIFGGFQKRNFFLALFSLMSFNTLREYSELACNKQLQIIHVNTDTHIQASSDAYFDLCLFLWPKQKFIFTGFQKMTHWFHWWLTKWVSASHHLLLCCPLWRFLGLQKWWRQSPTFFTITFLAKTKTHKCLKLHYSPLHYKNINFTVLFYRTFWNTKVVCNMKIILQYCSSATAIRLLLFTGFLQYVLL